MRLYFGKNSGVCCFFLLRAIWRTIWWAQPPRISGIVIRNRALPLETSRRKMYEQYSFAYWILIMLMRTNSSAHTSPELLQNFQITPMLVELTRSLEQIRAKSWLYFEWYRHHPTKYFRKVSIPQMWCSTKSMHATDKHFHFYSRSNY